MGRNRFDAIGREEKDKELAARQQETDKVKLQTILQKEVMEKERKHKTSTIELKIMKEKAIGEAERQSIVDNMIFNKNKKVADADKYSLERKAEGNEKLYTEEYLKNEYHKSMLTASKIIIGDVPQKALLNFGNSPKLDQTVLQDQVHN